MTQTQNKSFASSEKPPFPEPGSTFGPGGRYFCLGKLGRGTFCSIYKCVDLSYFHVLGDRRSLVGLNLNLERPRLRIVAAKVELSSFANSGVLDGEATVLHHLSTSMPVGDIPIFVDYVKINNQDCVPKNKSSSNVSGIIMEFLEGEDMHNLRDRHCHSVAAASKRRVNLHDAIYLCADVILPLLQRVHEAGVIHRDVKPSNCVRTGTGSKDRSFKLVDFGLSKSFVVPCSSSHADTRYEWTKPWHVPSGLEVPTLTYQHPSTSEGSSLTTPNSTNSSGTTNSACLRKERSDAEFRGTSMYASLRVHQSRDHCRRDDVWSLIYVFCDLASGGLPWMSYAANRDRNMCKIIKEWVHGEGEECNNVVVTDNNEHIQTDQTIITDRFEELLKGADYHLSKSKRKGSYSSEFARPLAMASDLTKVKALRTAFQHLSTLEFIDEPDYNLLRNCIKHFAKTDHENTVSSCEHTILTDATHVDVDIPPIEWEQPTPEEVERRRRERRGLRRCSMDDSGGRNGKQISSLSRPRFILLDKHDIDPLEEDVLIKAEWTRQHIAEAQVSNGLVDGYPALNLNETPSVYESGVASSSSSILSKKHKWSVDIEDMVRLPLSYQLKLAQVEYNAIHPDTIPMHLALRDWMMLGSIFVYDVWNSPKHERGNHRMNNDGYRREFYMRLVEKCLDSAMPFGNFSSRDCFYYTTKEEEHGNTVAGTNNKSNRNNTRKRKICVDSSDNSSADDNGTMGSSLVAFSKVISTLRALVEVEGKKLIAPPPVIKFKSDR